MAEIVIINPKFEVSFWGGEFSMPLLGKRATIPVACLPLLAALTPQHHNVTLIDENVEDIDWDLVLDADMVCLTGMLVQAKRMREILVELKTHDKFVVLGGPYVTCFDHNLEGLVDVIFTGEADETWPQFLEEWERGEHKTRYHQDQQTDMSKVPPPRMDLIKCDRYMYGSMQITRGCPYQCEFCDIIIMFGRRPRLKTSEQVLKELDTFLENGLKLVFIVDDNLIGNKKAIKPILRDIIQWQRERGYPMTFFTEASLDLAEDDELMDLMAEAYVQAVFVGIESPNEESLKETKKYQNVRPKAGTIMERVHRIQDHGIDIWCGMILGFDHDDRTIFQAIPEFIQQGRIAHALISPLYAIPTTPLYDRLKKEGRLDEQDYIGLATQTNVVPVNMTRQELQDGYVRVMQAVYDTKAYFDRVDALYVHNNFKHPFHSLPYWEQHKLKWLKRAIGRRIMAYGMYRRIMRHVKDPELREEYRRRYKAVVKARPKEPHIWFIYALKIAAHYHYWVMVDILGKRSDKFGAAFVGGVPNHAQSGEHGRDLVTLEAG